MDFQTQIQMINYAIVEASINGGSQQAYKDAVDFLRKNGIENIPNKRIYAKGTKPITTTFLHQHEKQIRTSGDIVLPPKFNGKLGPRVEKDKMYERIWALVDTHIPINKNRRRYIGLAGTYLPIIKKALGKNSLVICCENNRDQFKWLYNLTNEFMQGQGIIIENKDILKYLKTTDICPNIIDLDLMRCLTFELVDELLETIISIDKGDNIFTILNLVSCVGRGNSWKEHREAIEYFRENIPWCLTAETSGSYLERYHPIAYNTFVLM